MSKLLKLAAGFAVALFALTSLTACSQAEKLNMQEVTAVIDVRTPAEFAAGHLQGALNIDVESSDFANKVGSLDHAGDYIIYCHSGRRAGIAVTNMQSLGFTGKLTNAGGIAEATTTTGLAIVN